eukprot:Skav233697  [mRNA]  locus=scaffold1927:336348:338006:+ [translate_table: standard]
MASVRRDQSCLLLLTFLGPACFNVGSPWNLGANLHTKSVKLDHIVLNQEANCLKRTGCARAAINEDGASAEKPPNTLPKLFKRALRFSESGRNDKAIRTYEKIIREYPDCPEAWLNLGICRADPEIAMQAFEQALAIDPSYHDALYNKALVLDSLGQVSEAIENLCLAEKCATEQGDLCSSAMYCCSSGLLLVAEQQYDEALAAYDRAIGLDVGCVDAWVNRGELLCELQRFPEAIRSHSKALELSKDPDICCGILYNLAFTYAVTGQKVSCEEALNRAMSLDKTQVLTILLNFQGRASLLSQRRKEEMEFLKQRCADGSTGGNRQINAIGGSREGSIDWGLLLSVVQKLRSLEEDPRWILERLLDSAASSAATAYGTTWMESWFHLADQAELYAQAGPASMVVLGSSLGWQCFLGHLHLGYACCIGYEILKSQVAESQQLAQDFGLEQNIRFLCEDAMAADISSAKLLWLNTYAWPADVKQRLCEKLLKELSIGALVVSYEVIPAPDAFAVNKLELQYVEEMETSWNPKLLAHVYRCQKCAVAPQEGLSRR